jgi:hypothetical protein
MFLVLSKFRVLVFIILGLIIVTNSGKFLLVTILHVVYPLFVTQKKLKKFKIKKNIQKISYLYIK